MGGEKAMEPLSDLAEELEGVETKIGLWGGAIKGSIDAVETIVDPGNAQEQCHYRGVFLTEVDQQRIKQNRIDSLYGPRWSHISCRAQR